MAPQQTRQWILSNPPHEKPVYEGEDATFKIQTIDLPEVGKEQVLIKNKYFSNDPAQRGWIQADTDPERLYTKPVLKGEPMRTYAVSEVVQSNSDKLKVGQLISGQTTWAEYDVVDAAGCNPIQVNEQAGIRATNFIGALGGTGLTAYYGLVDVAGFKAGETVVVSGAAGATGNVVVQIAKHVVGAKRVIGIAGGAKKCAWVESLGADVCVDYKAADFKEQLLKATEGYVDVYFDNVGGEILDLMLTRVKRFGRIAACGGVSAYNGEGQGIKNWLEIVKNRITVKGFIVVDAIMAGRAGEIIGKLVAGVREGKIKIGEDSETVVPTKFEDVPKTWNLLFEGANQGKLITELTE
ncbi:NAD(P)-binding protein [Periconia macrospinosa]|uniref:NAD(P)-binding protein n=1 Tax=Periconia macrospinosa TaxID=97972 RepID=A0A2V1E884_9PLEO|nr:NAD(P)-binding protein [Periconia macrospinosa]